MLLHAMPSGTRISLTFPLARPHENRRGSILESLLFSHCLRCHCNCFSVFVLLFPVPGQSVEQENFVEPSQRERGRERKERHEVFSVVPTSVPCTMTNFLICMEDTPGLETGLSFGTLDELLIEWPPGNWWLCGLWNVPSTAEDNSNI